MFKKMVKLKNKKAFTLIEMMAVVAIVAILVAILVPVIGNSTVKSRAATNAANLRAVEAELATLKVSNPECFVSGAAIETGTLEGLAQTVYKYLYDAWYGEGEYNIQYGSIEAVGGTLTFYADNVTATGTSISQSGVPTSVAVKADTGMDVAEGMEMVIFLSGNTITAAYKGTNGVYFDKDCFAEVAETGKFTGEGTSSGGGGFVEWIEEAVCKANLIDGHSKNCTDNKNGTHTCSKCGVTENHEYVNGTCVWCNSICQHGSYSTTGAYKHECNVCGKSFDHDWNAETGKCNVCKYSCEHKIGVAKTFINGKCTICGFECKEHVYELSTEYNDQHVCKNCGVTGSHHDGIDYVFCTSCDDCHAKKVTTTETKTCTKGKTTLIGTAGYCSECKKYHKAGTEQQYTVETTTWVKSN